MSPPRDLRYFNEISTWLKIGISETLNDPGTLGKFHRKNSYDSKDIESQIGDKILRFKKDSKSFFGTPT